MEWLLYFGCAAARFADGGRTDAIHGIARRLTEVRKARGRICAPSKAEERLGFDQTPRAEIQIGKILLGTSNFSFVGPLISLVEGKRLFVEVLGSLEIVFFELDVCQLRYNLAEF